jgi:hypothetical protein
VVVGGTTVVRVPIGDGDDLGSGSTALDTDIGGR